MAEESRPRKAWIEWTGWLGVLLVVGAYALISGKIIESGSSLYQVMNLVGAIALGIPALDRRNWQSASVQVIWAGIALVALINMFRSS